MNAPPSAAAFFYTLNCRIKPSDRIQQQQKNKAEQTHPQARLRLLLTHRASTQKPSALLQSIFYVMVFVSQHTCSTCPAKNTRAGQQLQPTAPTKTHAKKNCLKLNNIKWSYRFATHFFTHAHASMPTPRKKIL